MSKFALANRRGTAARCILFLATGAMPPDEQGVKREPRLTIKQVSQRLNVDPSTLWRWERDGYLIPTRLGRKVLYNESDIIAIEEGRV